MEEVKRLAVQGQRELYEAVSKNKSRLRITTKAGCDCESLGFQSNGRLE